MDKLVLQSENMLSSFTVDNFKSYRQATLTLEPLTVLIGANGWLNDFSDFTEREVSLVDLSIDQSMGIGVQTAPLEPRSHLVS